MKVYQVTMGTYQQKFKAVDKQHAKAKFVIEMSKTSPSFPLCNILESIRAYEV